MVVLWLKSRSVLIQKSTFFPPYHDIQFLFHTQKSKKGPRRWLIREKHLPHKCGYLSLIPRTHVKCWVRLHAPIIAALLHWVGRQRQENWWEACGLAWSMLHSGRSKRDPASPTWKTRTYFSKLSTGLHLCPMACMRTHLHTCANKKEKK